MAATTLTYAEINVNTKKMAAVGGYTPEGFQYSTGTINNGFMGVVYFNEGTKEVIVSFKGTGSGKLSKEDLESLETDRPNKTLLGDLTADLKLSVGVIPNQASTAKEFLGLATQRWSPSKYDYTITGHSLGGYLAQVVSYWYDIDCVTFNAPGAWGDLQKAKFNLFKPDVMARSIRAGLQDSESTCVNFIHAGDPIGNFGIHRGRTNRLAGVRHAMKSIRDTIASHERWAQSSPFETRSGLKGLWDQF